MAMEDSSMTKKREATSILFETPAPEPVMGGEEAHPCTHSWDTKNAETSYAGGSGFDDTLIVTSVVCEWCGALHVAYYPVNLRR